MKENRKIIFNNLGFFFFHFLTMESSKLIDYLTNAKMNKLFDIVLKYVTMVWILVFVNTNHCWEVR